MMITSHYLPLSRHRTFHNSLPSKDTHGSRYGIKHEPSPYLCTRASRRLETDKQRSRLGSGEFLFRSHFCSQINVVETNRRSRPREHRKSPRRSYVGNQDASFV